MARTDPQINIRMPRDLLDSLATAATANKRGTSAEIVARLEAGHEGLRDRFAMAALTSIIANSSAVFAGASFTPWARHAEEAYKVADAMLAERSKP